MNMSTIGIAVIVVALVAAFTGIVSADPDGTDVSTGTAASTWVANSAESDAAGGGYITGIDLTVEGSTAKWQGYYGDIASTIVLEDGSGNQMYDWGAVTTLSGEVFATTADSAPLWANVNSVDATELAAATIGINGLWGWEDTADDADATFDTLGTITVAGTTISDTVATATDKILPASQGWQTLVIADAAPVVTKADYIFVGLIQDGATGYNTVAADYQLIVPTPDDETSETYYFYVELTVT